MLHEGPVLSIRLQSFENRKNWTDYRQELCIAFEMCVVLVDCVELQSVLNKRQTPTHRIPFLSNHPQTPLSISFRKFFCRKGMGAQSDCALSLYKNTDIFGSVESPPQFLIISLGKNPTISFSRIQKHPASSPAPRTLLPSGVTSNIALAASSLYSLGRTSVRMAPKLGQDLGLPKWSTRAAGAIIGSVGIDLKAEEDPKLDPRAKGHGDPVVAISSFSDPPREGLALTVGPTQGAAFSCYLAATDRLGRVLLLETGSCSILRVWKGYRDASCAFLGMPTVTSDEAPCLAILAPLKGLLEVWQLPHGDRLAAIRCGPYCRLFQPGPALNPTLNQKGEGQQPSTLSRTFRAFLLGCKGGRLWEVRLPAGVDRSRSLTAVKSLSPGDSPPPESTLFQALCDLIRRRKNALTSARLLLTSASPAEPKPTLAAGVEDLLMSADLPEEERAALELMGLIRAPGRLVRGLDLLTSLWPKVSPGTHQSAVDLVLASIDSALGPNNTTTTTLQRHPPKRKSMSFFKAAFLSGTDQSEPATPPHGLTAHQLRRRAPPGSAGLDEAEDGDSPDDADVSPGADVAGVDLEGFQLAYRERLRERRSLLTWQAHLARVYRMMLTGQGAPPPSKEEASQKLPGLRGWDYGGDLRGLFAPADPAQQKSTKVNLPSSVEFTASFRCDLASAPPPWSQEPSRNLPEASVPPSLSPGAEDTVARVLFRGPGHTNLTLTAFRLVPLSGPDRQRLFLSWLGRESLGTLLGTNPDDMCALVRALRSGFRQGEVGGAAGGGWGWPALFEWCQVSTECDKVLLLARTVSVVADVAVAEIEGDASEWEDDSWREEPEWGEAEWLQMGADQWRALVGEAERSFSMFCAVGIVSGSGARHLAHRARRGPSLAELATFPAATWIARLELVISTDPNELAALERSAMAKTNPQKGSTHQEVSNARSLLGRLFLHFPGSCHLDSLAAQRAAELCREWAAGGGGDLLMVAQCHLAMISTVGLKGGTTCAMWHSLIGPRAASLVSAVQRGSVLNVSDLNPGGAWEATGAYEQILTLLYDCAVMAESGAGTDPAVVKAEDELARKDATCRDAILDFRLRPPSSDRVYLYILLVRVLGIVIGLGLQGIDLARIFPSEIVSNFPVLFQDSIQLNGRSESFAVPSESTEAARVAFLQAAVNRQKEIQKESGKNHYSLISMKSIAGDLNVPQSKLNFS